MTEISSKPSTTIRRLIDVSPITDQIEAAAINDSKITGNLYSLTEYCREIITNYLQLKEANPKITPADLPRMKI